MRVPLASDTSRDVESRQIQDSRQMSTVEKAAVVTGLTSAAFAMTLAGIRHRHPEEPEAAHRKRLAIILLGADVANRAFPGSIEHQ